MSWNSNEEKLLCHIVLDDRAAQHLWPGCAEAFWRAFIVQNRKTGQITGKWRYKYRNGDRTWYEMLAPAECSDPQEAMAVIRDRLVICHQAGLFAFGMAKKEVGKAMVCYYPPDDKGDVTATIVWLEMQDLIEVRVVEEIKGEQ